MANDKPTPAEKAEAAAIRRRWITLGEVLAVAAVVISGLTFWNSYTERSTSAEEKAVAAKRADTAAATLILKAEPIREGDVLRLSPRRDDQVVQSQTIRFPAALKLSPVETTGDARIEAEWFADALKRARKAAGRGDESAGDERLPIAVTTRFLGGDTPHEDIAIYDVGYALDGRFLIGAAVRLRGLSLVGRADASSAQARLDSLWKARQPTISSSEKK